MSSRHFCGRMVPRVGCLTSARVGHWLLKPHKWRGSFTTFRLPGVFFAENGSCTGSRWATTSSIHTKKEEMKENGDDNNDNNSMKHLPTQNAQGRSCFLSGEGDPDHRGPQVAADHQHTAEGGLLRGESPYKVKSNITTQTHIVILNPLRDILVETHTVLIAESCKVISIHTALKPQICLRGFEDTCYPPRLPSSNEEKLHSSTCLPYWKYWEGEAELKISKLAKLEVFALLF